MLTLTVKLSTADRTRYITRMLSSHATLAEILDWAATQCAEEEQVTEITFSSKSATHNSFHVNLPKPRPESLSRRLFH